MKNQALIEILFILLSRDSVTAKYLAERFNCSIRTVYRYIDELSICVPIYNTRGRNGGFAISSTYKLSSTFLTKEESEILLGALRGMTNEFPSPTLTKIIDKIASISKKKNSETHIDFGNIIIDGAWENTEGYKQTIAFLEESIESKTVINISYRDREGTSSERKIEPHTLILKQGLWYCYAYCQSRQDFRLFKIGRIEKAIKTNETFERKTTDKLQEILDDWYKTLQTETVDLELDVSIKADVEEWLGVDKIYEVAGGKLRASANLPIDNILASKILSFGNKIKVLAPEKLKKEVIKIATSVVEEY